MNPFLKFTAVTAALLVSNSALAVNVYLDNDTMYGKTVRVIDKVCNAVVFEGYVEEGTKHFISVCNNISGYGNVDVYDAGSHTLTNHALLEEGEKVTLY